MKPTNGKLIWMVQPLTVRQSNMNEIITILNNAAIDLITAASKNGTTNSCNLI